MPDDQPTAEERVGAIQGTGEKCMTHQGGTVAKWNCGRCWSDMIRAAEQAAEAKGREEAELGDIREMCALCYAGKAPGYYALSEIKWQHLEVGEYCGASPIWELRRRRTTQDAKGA